MLVYETGERNGSWHVGEETPFSWVRPDGILLVVADGDELAYILDRFRNLPYVHAGYQGTWTGDFAAFILNHLGA